MVGKYLTSLRNSIIWVSHSAPCIVRDNTSNKVEAARYDRGFAAHWCDVGISRVPITQSHHLLRVNEGPLDAQHRVRCWSTTMLYDRLVDKVLAVGRNQSRGSWRWKLWILFGPLCPGRCQLAAGGNGRYLMALCINPKVLVPQAQSISS